MKHQSFNTILDTATKEYLDQMVLVSAAKKEVLF